MPQTIINDEGEEVEVYLSTEVEEFKTQAEKAKEVDDLKKQLEDTNKLLEESTPEGLKNVRDAYKRAKAALKAQGIETDDQGNPVQKPNYLSPEEVQQIAEKAAKKLAVDSVVKSSLSKYSEEEKAVIRLRFEKLTAGEQVDLDNVHDHLNSAIGASRSSVAATDANRSPGSMGGEPTRVEGDNKRFSETDKGREAAKAIFGKDAILE